MTYFMLNIAILIIALKALLFPEASAMTFAAVKNETVV